MSLFQSLTNTNIAIKDAEGNEPTPEAIGATALIQSLLEVTAFDACASSKRNAFTTFSVISKARDLCRNIHTRIKVVDSSPLDSWDAFVVYTEAIDPLEELLFKLVDWLEEEADKLLNATTAIKDAIEFIKTWETNQASLKTYYHSDSEELKKLTVYS
ncbi:hypothetical protein FIBSPDRAFT_1056152 [Athelia psychrophila]|uniref:Uncharacterized protein n=1 Tax=Athelia psychrophila TaxID=1759441 RepID=A0A167SLB5_9AGAM|nr:hypothetical protein FIBSPDRAFT_1056152 [Fibularhizoctonia sp. CBS 109695]